MDNGTIALVATLVSVVLAVLGLLAAWYWRQRGSPAKAVVEADDRSVAAGGDVTGQVATGDQSTIASGQGVAVGGQPAGPVVIAQPGANVSVNTNVSVRTHQLQSSALPAVRDPYGRGMRLQEADSHEQSIREFENAFAAAPDERARASIHIQIGISLMSLSRLTEAEGHFRQAAQVIDQDRRIDNLGKK